MAACVVFKKGRPAKKEYRFFNIKTVSGPDDFKSIEEVVYRRYLRLINEKKPLLTLLESTTSSCTRDAVCISSITEAAR